MGASKLHLPLITAVALGAALVPAAAAAAAPVRATAVQEVDVAALTQHESVLDSAAQRITDEGTRGVQDEVPAPPAWLLLLLVPILAGGAVATTATVRRLR